MMQRLELGTTIQGEQVSKTIPEVSEKQRVKKQEIEVCEALPMMEGVELRMTMQGEEVSKTIPEVSDKDRVKKQGVQLCEGIEVSKALPMMQGVELRMTMQGEEVSETIPQVSKKDRVKNQGGEVYKALPEDLVERILAMVPFPYISKARALSTSWLARFSPVSSQDDELKKRLATSFQNQVGEWSRNWKTFCPIFVNRKQGFMMGYDRASHSWPRISSLCFLPKHLLCTSTLQIDGVFLVLSSREGTYVANLLTRKWKLLPPAPPASGRYLLKRLVTLRSSETYKVIVFYGVNACYLAQIYDSKSNIWRSKMLMISTGFSLLGPPAYLNGILYMVVGQNPTDLLGFNVQDETFEELRLSTELTNMGRKGVHLVTCNGNLLMIVQNWFNNTVHVLRIDLGLLRASKVGRSPPPDLKFGLFVSGPGSDGDLVSGPGSDGDCVFFWLQNLCGLAVYNMHEDVWSCVHLDKSVGSVIRSFYASRDYKWSFISSCQPDLNPFLAV